MSETSSLTGEDKGTTPPFGKAEFMLEKAKQGILQQETGGRTSLSINKTRGNNVVYATYAALRTASPTWPSARARSAIGSWCKLGLLCFLNDIRTCFMYIYTLSCLINPSTAQGAKSKLSIDAVVVECNENIVGTKKRK